ncbi:MAG: DNA ligase D, partial [Polyangiaceae bacterium]|nr:DNA ligase D [Polyangiaceae bacterium]
KPDSAVIDLDPDEALPWKSVVRAAFEVRAVLEDLGLKSWVKMTGGKGLHVCFPIVRRTSWDDFKELTRSVALTIVASDPKRYTANMAKAQRKGKIFIDYLRNGRGATAVAPYSTRARVGAPVAAPITWDELAGGAHPRDFDLRSMMNRLDSQKVDPWADFLTTKQSITQATWKKIAA